MRQRLVLDLDELGAVLCLVAAGREHQSDGLPGEARPLRGKRMLRSLDEPLDREHVDERHVGQLGCRQDSLDAVDLQRGRDADPVDAGMWQRRAYERRVKRSREDQIGDIAPRVR